jgi:Zn ribbon nucleic-acid-binding protein
MEGMQPLDEQAIRQELHRRMLAGGGCPQCQSDRLVQSQAASDFPGYSHLMIYCHACGLIVHVEQKLDAQGVVESSAVVGASGLRSSWASFKLAWNQR